MSLRTPSSSWKVVGGPAKMQGNMGREVPWQSCEGGTSHASGYPPSAPSQLRSFCEETYLIQYLLWANSYETWEGLGTEWANLRQPTYAVIHEDHQRKQTENMATTVVIHQRQWSPKISRSDNCKYYHAGDQSSDTSTWRLSQALAITFQTIKGRD